MRKVQEEEKMEALERKIELEASSAIAKHNSRLSAGIFDAAAELRPQVVFRGNFQPGADAKSQSEAAAELAAWGPRAKEYWSKVLAEERHESLRAHHEKDEEELRAQGAHPSDVARLTSSASARLASRVNRQQMLAGGSPVPQHADAPPAPVPAAQAVRTKADAIAALAAKHAHEIAAFEATHEDEAGAAPVASAPAAPAAPAAPTVAAAASVPKVVVAAAAALPKAVAPKVVEVAAAVPKVAAASVPKVVVAAAPKVALATEHALSPSASAAPPSTIAAAPSVTATAAVEAAEALAKEKVHEAGVELRLRQEQAANAGLRARLAEAAAASTPGAAAPTPA
ncbi:hypothetical protein T484DRAFT_2023630, partial [Baffinella frigidus]